MPHLYSIPPDLLVDTSPLFNTSPPLDTSPLFITDVYLTDGPPCGYLTIIQYLTYVPPCGYPPLYSIPHGWTSLWIPYLYSIPHGWTSLGIPCSKKYPRKDYSWPRRTASPKTIDKNNSPQLMTIVPKGPINDSVITRMSMDFENSGYDKLMVSFAVTAYRI
ncbi:hypothetical protein CEXT_620391 [Caerostris extrusa]|uniref:Uncharacterized protein n=1 Tax=Caerostris extrusa TaxID=172846 RepID=A0AAV4P0M9_CAEEX|nr:hypothetical protein CEXT_620391 [Caerostris extrusa]